MKAPTGWNNVKPMTGESKEVLTEGGHGCVITMAECITENWGGQDEEKLRLEIDIKEGSSLDGFYSRQFQKKLKFASNPKWPGEIKQSTTTKEGDTNPFFKGLITAIEDSNPGYNFERTGYDEKTLIGKKVGYVFRDEPFVASDGAIVHYVKPAWACKYDEAKDQPIPTPKKVRGQRAESVSKVDFTQMQEAADVELPFE